MSLSTSNKVLFGVGVAIAAAVVGAFHWWMAFLVVWLGVAALLLLIYAESRVHGAAASSRATSEPPATPNAWNDHQKQMLGEMERLEEDLAVDRSNKHLAGNIWHHHG